MRPRRAGATLIEVLIAIAILGIGVMAAFGLQASSLRATRSAAIGQDLNNIAVSEVDLQRTFARTITTPAAGLTCRTAYERPIYSCEVIVYPCRLVGGTVSCVNSEVAFADSVARQVTVVVTGHGRRVELATVVR